MQSKHLINLLLIFLSWNATTQNIQVTDEKSYESFIEQLNSSKDLKYQDILIKYDTYIEIHSSAIDVKISRCKFIGTAYYDEYEGYNLNWEETDKCIEQLYEMHPNYPEVIIYKIENIYSEEKTALIKTAIDIYYDNVGVWSDDSRARLFELAAYHYSDSNQRISLDYADKAQRFDKDLDLSLLIAQTYVHIGDTKKAREVLGEALYYDHEV